MIPTNNVEKMILLRNVLSVLIFVLGLTWLWAAMQEHWLKEYMEPSIVVVGTLITFCQFLISRWSRDSTNGKNKFYNIPNTKQHRDYLAQAKSSIANDELNEALGILSEINVKSVKNSVLLLSARWTNYRQDQIYDVLDHTDKTLNRIRRDVLSLIASLEAEMNTYGEVEKEVREYLQRRYTNRLQQKLANRQPINLRRVPTTEGTSEETVETFVTVNADGVKAHIAAVFQAAYGRLLITGKPGAGKTVLLLQLELALLESEADLLPVVLNLATWQKDYITLESWLKEILPAELGATKKYAADILQQNRLILLLDGLDEVEESGRVSCLDAIGRYRASTNFQYVITSRIEEYCSVSKDAPVNLQIEVSDLTLDQMEAELTRMGHKQAEAMPLLYALKKHPLLREAAQVPFYFNTLQLLFAGGKTLSDLNLKGHTAEAIQAELIPQFVAYALTIPPDKNYTPKQAAYWLSFVADNMTKHNKVVFELSDLQYDWSPVALSRWHLFVAIAIYSLFAGVFGGFVGGLILGVTLGVIFDLVAGVIFGLVLGLGISLFTGLVLGLIGGLLVGLDRKASLDKKMYLPIQPKEGIKLSWSLYFQSIKDYCFEILFVSFFAGLSFIRINVFAGLISVFIVGASFGLIPLLRRDSIASLQLSHPYQRFKNSARMLDFSILQHWHLMYVFSKKGWLPWKIVPFLNDMVAQQLLECPDGATWRFRHRILQDHFTKRWEELGRQEELSKLKRSPA